MQGSPLSTPSPSVFVNSLVAAEPGQTTLCAIYKRGISLRMVSIERASTGGAYRWPMGRSTRTRNSRGTSLTDGVSMHEAQHKLRWDSPAALSTTKADGVATTDIVTDDGVAD